MNKNSQLLKERFESISDEDFSRIIELTKEWQNEMNAIQMELRSKFVALLHEHTNVTDDDALEGTYNLLSTLVTSGDITSLDYYGMEELDFLNGLKELAESNDPDDEYHGPEAGYLLDRINKLNT